MEKLNKLNKIFNKIYYNLFIEHFTGKIQNNFPKDYYRWDLINYLIEKKNYKNYLEIGCDQNQLFSKVKIDNKIGVDPESGGNIKTTSDNFFSDNTKKFDIIFIDPPYDTSLLKYTLDYLKEHKFLRNNKYLYFERSKNDKTIYLKYIVSTHNIVKDLSIGDVSYTIAINKNI